MCGIAGIINFNGAPVNRADLGRMNGTLAHRGPDDSGLVMLGDKKDDCRFLRSAAEGDSGSRYAGFAHRRLSIIDVSAEGVQPMNIDDGAVWIVFNGEIFNYIELREELAARGRRFTTGTDTEVLLHAYDEWGTACLERFNGMWAFAIWDTRRRRLFMARDRFGIKPFYYTWDGARFAFASEPKALLSLDWISAEPDDRAVADYLVHSRVDCFRWTFFSAVQRLDPGCFIDAGFNDATLPGQTRWWRLEDTLHDPPASDEECAERFRELFESSVRFRLRSDVPVGTCLSGGLDSASVVCVARPWLEPGNQKAYSAVFDPSFAEDETQWVDEVVGFADVESHRVTPSSERLVEDIQQFIRTQDEPFGSTSQYSQYSVFRLARENGTTVTLDGQGADEELAGYHYLFPVHVAGLVAAGKPFEAMREFGAFVRRTNATVPASVLATGAGFLPHRAMIRWANRYDASRSISWVNGDVVRRAAGIGDPTVPGCFDRLNGRLYELFAVSSLPALLRYEDRSSMAFSIEARLPFLDHLLVSFLFSLPARHKIRDGYTKYVMREAMRGIIPERVRTRTDKVGFATPEASWWRGDLLPFVRDVFGDRRTRARRLYDTEKLLTLVGANTAGKVHAGRAIWRALCMELWFREFID